MCTVANFHMCWIDFMCRCGYTLDMNMTEQPTASQQLENYPVSIAAQQEAKDVWPVLRMDWLVSLVTLPACAAVLMGYGNTAQSPVLAKVFMVLALVWLMVLVPAVVLLRNHCLWAWLPGRRVLPKAYLRGMRQVWWVLMFSGGLGFMAAAFGGKAYWTMGLSLAALAFLLICMTAPTRKAMQLS